jgi:hypothetical protein
MASAAMAVAQSAAMPRLAMANPYPLEKLQARNGTATRVRSFINAQFAAQKRSSAPEITPIIDVVAVVRRWPRSEPWKSSGSTFHLFGPKRRGKR